MSRISEKLRTTFSRLVLEWGISPRYQTELPITYKIVTLSKARRASRAIEGRCFDLSETGIGLLTGVITADGMHAYFSQDMIANTELELIIELADGPLILKGTVCRYQKLEQGEYPYLLGIKFIDCSDANRSRLQNLLQQLKLASRRTPRY